VCILYEVVLFLVGVVAFGLRFHGHLLSLVLTGLAFPACLVSAGIFLVSVCHTNQQINVVGNVGGIFLGALGGGYVPLSVLPSWARDIAPVTPTYWAVKGLRGGVLPGYSLGSGLVCTGVLLGVAAAFGVGAAVRFRFEETKPGVG
jgi:ABC-2 type transport system permease protein